MSSSPILKDKNAIVFGAGGSIGAAVAKEFAAEGAELFLAGRTKSNVEEVAKEITKGGGRAHAAVVDAMDGVAVSEYIDNIAKRSGRIDIVFNAVGVPAKEYGNGKSAVDLAIEEFMLPMTTVLKSQFITAREAARHMVQQHSGVIVLLTGGPARSHVKGTSAIGAAFGAIEALTRNMALDVSPAGVRVVCIRSAAMPDTRTIQDTVDAMVGMMNISKDQAIASLANFTLLKVSPSASDTAKAAAFLASDRARMMTGTVLNSSGGAVAD